MKVLILAAGYGTRLARDLAESSEYAHLIGCPKPLLPVAGKPLITYWMEMLSTAHVQPSDVYIIVSVGGARRMHFSFTDEHLGFKMCWSIYALIEDLN